MEGTESIDGIKGVGRANQQDKNEKHVFQVKTKGYTKQFTSYGSAEKEFKKLQGKAEREQRPYKVTLSRKDGRNWEELDKAEVKKSYYED